LPIKLKVNDEGLTCREDLDLRRDYPGSAHSEVPVFSDDDVGYGGGGGEQREPTASATT